MKHEPMTPVTADSEPSISAVPQLKLSGRRDPSAWLILALLFLIYNANLRLVRIDDSLPARLLPFTFLMDHSIYLDRWLNPYLPSVHGPFGVYFAARYHQHWLSSYPLITPLIVTPLYVLPAWWLAHLRPVPAPGDIVLVALIDVMEKLSASLLAALSGAVLYSALRRVVPAVAAVVIALTYGVASSTWSISSQALWKHGLEELCFAVLLWALIADDGRRRYAIIAGVAAAAAASNTPPFGLLALLLAVFFRRRRERLAAYLVPVVLIGGATLIYNHHFFGRLIGPYVNPIHPSDYLIYRNYRTPFFEAALGMLFSPSRGMLIFSPWVIFALWGLVKALHSRQYAWAPWVVAALVFVFAGYARYSVWWAGWCYGPRYLTDFLPFFAFFLACVWNHLERRRALKAMFVAAVVFSVAVQAIGAFNYRLRWDALPVSVDRAPQRLWDWRDNQIWRTYRDGRGVPVLYDQFLMLLATERANLSMRKPAARPPIPNHG